MANPYTSLMAGPTMSAREQQSLIANPELVGLDRQRKMAELLLAEGLKGQPEGQMVSGYYVAPHWTQRLNPVLNRLMGEQGLKDVDEKTLKLAEALRKRDEQETKAVLDQMLGRAAVTEEMAGPAYQGVSPSMEISPAVAPNPQEAMRLAMMSQSPQVRAMLPSITEQAMPKPITPYQQAQLDIDRQKLTQITPYQKEQLKLDRERLELDRQTKGLGKDLTEAQGKASAFQSQMVSANNVVRNLEANGFNPTSFKSQAQVKLAGGATNPIIPVAAQQYKQAQDQWSEAYLRFKTGAAATEQEVQRNNRTFFPVLGDKPEQIAQKAAAREQAERDIGIAAGRGANLGAQPMIGQANVQAPAGLPNQSAIDAELRRRGLR